jgi:hypothetical protein
MTGCEPCPSHLKVSIMAATSKPTSSTGPKTGQSKPRQDETQTELEPHQLDVQAPMTDDDLAQALEDTFPASDPINFAGSITGIPAETPSATTPSAAPIGAHPLAGSDEERADAAADTDETATDASSRTRQAGPRKAKA